MPIRDLILTSDDPKQALQELKFQWTEMAGIVNGLLDHTNTTRNGTVQIGDIQGGDYLAIEPDGSIEFNGDATVFKDQLGDITKIKVVGTGLAVDTAESTLNFAPNCDYTTDYAYENVQFNHDRKNGSSVYPHIHWFQQSNNTPNFLLLYRWQVNGDEKTTSWTSYVMKSNAFTFAGTTMNQITYGAGIPPPANDDVSIILQLRLSRDKANASGAFTATDSYTTTVAAMSFDFHIEVDTIGSRQQYVK